MLATGCWKASDPSPDENEFCEPVVVGLPSFVSHVRSGELTDTDIAYMCLDRLGALATPG